MSFCYPCREHPFMSAVFYKKVRAQGEMQNGNLRNVNALLKIG